MAFLEVVDICKHYNGQQILNDINLELDKGKVLCLLGPSGCGKTTLLRIIAGLEKQDKGEVRLDNINIGKVPPYKRKFRMMFQELSLFPHKNVFDNIAFGLEIEKLSRDTIRKRTEEMLELVGLRGLEKRNVNELSGGEQQRVALARSLAPEPRLLMLDEPLGSLDLVLRKRLLHDLIQILRKVGVTTIFVTHDQDEALAVGDLVGVMHAGRMEQIDVPEALYKKPKNPVVAQFLGFQNLIKGKISEDGIIKSSLGEIRTPGIMNSNDSDITILLRPESARIVNPDDSAGEGNAELAGTVIDRLFQGRYYQVTMKTEGGEIFRWDLPSDQIIPNRGEFIKLIIDLSCLEILENR